MTQKRITVPDIIQRKGGSPIVCLTAYTAPFAKILDEHTDLLLVGDTVGMVLYGMDSTLPVTVDIMVEHGKAVMRGSQKSCVVVDMPFGSYEPSSEVAFQNAARILKETGCSAVKLEGGKDMADTIRYLTGRGIPVLAHIGLMPQHVHVMGGYRFQGRDEAQRQKLLDDAHAVQEAGAFAVVLEGIEENVAQEITEKLAIPTIGIGASAVCDGQILVTEDMAGLLDSKPAKFVRQYGNLRESLGDIAAEYAKEVRSRFFPAKEHCYNSKKSSK